MIHGILLSGYLVVHDLSLQDGACAEAKRMLGKIKKYDAELFLIRHYLLLKATKLNCTLLDLVSMDGSD